MILTRAVDNRLKQFFTSGEVRYGDAAFQGKGFRSLGQEAIYAAGDPPAARRGVSRSRRAAGRATSSARSFATSASRWRCGPDAATVRMVLNAQMGKEGPPMDGKDLHIGDFEWGILPADGAALDQHAVDRRHGDGVRARGGRAAWRVSFIGEGGSSLGEWHEAINLCAARRLPAVFCLENNQTALSTPVRDQSAVRVFADKAGGLRHPGHHDRRHRRRRDRRGVHVGGRSGARRRGPDAHRARLHAHVRPRASRRHALSRQGAAALVGVPAGRGAGRLRRPRRCTRSGRRRIRSRSTPRRLERDGRDRAQAISSGSSARREALVESEARAVVDGAVAGGRRPPASACSPTSRRECASSRSNRPRGCASISNPALPPLDAGPAVRQERAGRSSKR